MKKQSELEQEIMAYQQKMDELRAENRTAMRIEEKDKMATELHEMYESFVRAGFTEEQAWELTKTIIHNSTLNRG